MNRRLGLLCGLGTLLAGSVAFAQASSSEVSIGYGGLPYKSSGETNTGIQLSDGLLLHAGVGAEAGYDTNVYYDATKPLGSSIFRVMPFAELTNATRNGVNTQLTFDARAGLQYRHYGNSTIRSAYADAWNPNAGLSLSYGGAQFAFGLADLFARVEDPPYATNGVPQLGAIQRTNNQASVEGRWAPGGGRLTTTLRYVNMVDVYDGNYSYANSVQNTLMLDVAWKWLPKTAIFVNVQQGYIDYYNRGNIAKSNAFPLTATVGARGLLTAKTSVLLALGYTNSFYQTGGSTSGVLGQTYANLAFTILPTQLSRVVIGGRHDFVNAVISNFAYEDTLYASYVQQLIGRLALDLSGRYTHLDFGGLFVDPAQAGRIDDLFQVGATLDYFLRNWAYVGAGYSMLDNRSNKPADSYLKQQVFARLGVTY